MEYFCDVGGIMQKADLCSGSYVESVLFISLSDDGELEGSSFLESGIYLCMVCDKSERELEYIEAMRTEIDTRATRSPVTISARWLTSSADLKAEFGHSNCRFPSSSRSRESRGE